MNFLLIFQNDSVVPKELFTKESLETLIGLTGMVYVASNSLQRAFNFNPKWLALAIAQILSIIAVYLAYQGTEANFINYLIGVFNGFLVYLTSAGATGVGHNMLNANKGNDELPLSERNLKRGFTTKWW
jgi:hypothetical protein